MPPPIWSFWSGFDIFSRFFPLILPRSGMEPGLPELSGHKQNRTSGAVFVWNGTVIGGWATRRQEAATSRSGSKFLTGADGGTDTCHPLLPLFSNATCIIEVYI
jgi:hypothetical protein